MQKILKHSLFLLSLILFQLFFSDILDIRGIFPDLFLIYLVYMAFRMPPVLFLITAFLLGLLQDLMFNTSLIGLSSLIKVLFAFFCLKLTEIQRSINSIAAIILFSILIVLALNLYDSLFYFGAEREAFSLFYHISLPRIIYTLGIFLIVNFYYPLIRSV